MADIACLGEALIDFVAHEPCADVGAASGFVKAAGGAPANVAVGVARLGMTSAFLGKVGDDPFGRFLERTFTEAAVDTSGMVFHPSRRTGLAFVSLTSSGERDFCFFRNPSADMTYRSSELALDKIDACRCFHFGSITLIDPLPRAATLAAARRARLAGKLISYDPNLRPPLWPSLDTARRTIRLAMKLADVVKVSEEELAFIVRSPAGLPDRPPARGELAACATRLLAEFPNIALLAVTRGKRGCCWWMANSDSEAMEGYPVKPVDTTGAGDGFVAGLLTGLLEAGITAADLRSNMAGSLTRIMARANLVGALTTTKKGAIPALPCTQDLEQFLSR